MSKRSEVQERLGAWTGSTEEFMKILDVVVNDLIGKDDTEDMEMPKTWNIALKKQYINFRNHLRRSMRSNWGKGE